jgi:hypothetical protein
MDLDGVWLGGWAGAVAVAVSGSVSDPVPASTNTKISHALICYRA